MANWLFDPMYEQAIADLEARRGKEAFGKLNRLRRTYGWDVPDLAPLEHRAFMQYLTQDSPIMGGLSGAVAPAAYYAAKKLGIRKADTPATLPQLFGGYQGYLEGLFDG